MDARFYNSDEINIEKLANDLENIYRAQGYQVQQLGNQNQTMVQLKKGSDFEALIGLQAALTVIIQRSGGGVIAMIGHQKWVDKAAVGAVGIIAAPILWPLMLTAGAGAIRQASLGNQVLNVVDGLVRQQRPEIQVGPIPVHIIPQIQQQWAPPPYASQIPQYTAPGQQVVISVPAPQPPMATISAPSRQRLHCPSCNTPYDVGDTFCTGCGRSLVPPKTLCPNCGTEVKDNSSFCPNCGASVFQSTQSAQPAQQQPAYTSPAPTLQAPTYTPPAPQAPVYTPPPEPPVPLYTPPAEPPVMPKPKVTFIPGTAKQEPATPKQPAQPDVPYYTPPANPQPIAPKAQTPTPAPRPIAAKPSVQPAFDPTATWGSLTFSDGKQVKLAGERAVVGRYDHDVVDSKPEVDLNGMQGADTVSRIHAAFEHIGSAYTLTDLNSTNSTRINSKRLEPDNPTPINDGDTLAFGKVTCTFKKA